MEVSFHPGQTMLHQTRRTIFFYRSSRLSPQSRTLGFSPIAFSFGNLRARKSPPLLANFVHIEALMEKTRRNGPDQKSRRSARPQKCKTDSCGRDTMPFPSPFLGLVWPRLCSRADRGGEALPSPAAVRSFQSRLFTAATRSAARCTEDTRFLFAVHLLTSTSASAMRKASSSSVMLASCFDFSLR
jgi:hypothetical protein